MSKSAATRPRGRNCAVTDVAFARYLQAQGLAPSTIGRTRGYMRYAARWTAQRGWSLQSFQREQLFSFFRRSVVRRWRPHARKHYRAALGWWLKYLGRYHFKEPAYPWLPLLGDYLLFLAAHRGFAPRTCAVQRIAIHALLKWLFGTGEPDWTRIRPPDIWRYAQQFRRGRAPGTLNQELTRVRLFLRFVLMRGAVVEPLIHAVPRFANYGQAPRIEPLTDAQRRQLLACFDRSTPVGTRDYCLTLCMVDLGLRPGEVSRLLISDIDWSRHILNVPPTKTDRGRQLPIPVRVAKVLRHYVRQARVATTSERLFIRAGKRHPGSPLKSRDLAWVMTCAYRRCGFPATWHGTYRLRHTFATRLHARGVDLKQIADLLGHRYLQTTAIYAKVDLIGLRALAVPWPF